MSDTPTLPPGWRASKAPNGKTFYYNRETKETQWNPPAIDRAKLAERAKQAGVFGTAPRRDVPSPRPPIGASKLPRVIICYFCKNFNFFLVFLFVFSNIYTHFFV